MRRMLTIVSFGFCWSENNFILETLKKLKLYVQYFNSGKP